MVNDFDISLTMFHLIVFVDFGEHLKSSDVFNYFKTIKRALFLIHNHRNECNKF